ncbi:MAG: nucleoside recognition domain-containing protein [Firmicutes bacterium]|nr:nucleoside recognition domain-containing protein [Bacillota bacterium]
MSAVMNVLGETSLGAAQAVLGIGAVVVPLMIAVEVLKALNVFQRLSDWLAPAARGLGLSANAAFPLVAGAVLGLSYGSGLIIDSAQEGRLDRRDAYLLTAFLAPCHAVFEDTLIFVPLGANPWVVLSMRFAAAVAVTLVAGRLWAMRERAGRGLRDPALGKEDRV